MTNANESSTLVSRFIKTSGKGISLERLMTCMSLRFLIELLICVLSFV